MATAVSIVREEKFIDGFLSPNLTQAYLGRTGYSKTENTNNIDTSHLHFGLQLIFDESQKEGVNEIWVDCYNLTKFLYQNRSETLKNVETKEYYRVYDIKNPEVDEYLKKKPLQ